MKTKKVKSRNASWWVLFFVAAFLIFNFHPEIYAETIAPESEYPEYEKALKDTKETTQAEISRELLAVVPRADVVNYRRLQGGQFIWEDPDYPEKSRVLVVALMDKKSYNDYYKAYMGKDYYSLTKSLWVTVVPEMGNIFIGKEECPPKPNRLIKVLGLNPVGCAAYDTLVEMWVEPKDLFRPSPDPEITDHESELATPAPEENKWIYPSDINPFLLIDPYALFRDNSFNGSSQTFKEWYSDRAATIYDNTEGEGYPWTRLGYTYDWGDEDNHVGLSEFIIRIDPYWGFVNVTLKRAINFGEDLNEWNANFRCGPKAPMMTLTTSATAVTFDWTKVTDADGYYLLYKKVERGARFEPPFEENNKIDVGDTNTFSTTLASGDCFYAAIQSYSQKGRGGISNIEYFYIP
jgi:hypothetical protein